MLKKVVFSAGLFLIFTTSAFAQTEGTSPSAMTHPLKPLRTAVQQDKDVLRAKIQEFKSQISLIRDERKKMIVEKIDNDILASNSKLTDKMSQALAKMSIILDKLKIKSTALKTEGKDTSALDAAITAAQTAIDNAKTSVAAQSQKQYSATITDDITLKNVIGQMVSGFRLDIMTVHKQVSDAKASVAAAIAQAAKLMGSPTTATGSAIIQE